jgi:hypothetical protein
LSLFIDIKYLNRISARLPKFKKKSEYLWNCRCILCGDSKTNLNKARGFFYRGKGDLSYKCHNCNRSIHFGTFLKEVDPLLYKEYVFERYAKGENGKAHAAFEPVMTFREPAPLYREMSLDAIAPRLSTLPDDNEAVAYCLARQIPRDLFHTLRFLPRVEDVLSVVPAKYQDRSVLKGDLPKLMFPLFDGEGRLTGLNLRTLRNEEPRYILLKNIEDSTLIFGMERVDLTEHVYVTEGAMDSLFVENAIAMNGIAFAKVEELGLDREQFTLVLDNQPRNREVVKSYSRFVEQGYRICIWPCIEQKDINDMVLAGLRPTEIIKAHTHQGLMAQAALTQWKNC